MSFEKVKQISEQTAVSFTQGFELLIVGESILSLIAGKALSESCAFMKLAGLQCIQIFVGFQFSFRNLQHFHGYIGAMVCGSFTGSQQIFQHKTVLHGAEAIS